MSVATLVLGESGTGKSASLRNFNPDDVLLIQVVPKPLPFRADGWDNSKKNEIGVTIYATDNYIQVCKALSSSRKKIIIIDDFQYLMANEYMRRSQETGFGKFTEIGKHAWEIFDLATKLPADKRVYILSHTEESDLGKTRIKTIGKMLNDKITLEGLLTIVLRTNVSQGNYQFSTQNDGNDTTKSPMGMFEEQYIDNDLNAVDTTICEYYNIEK